jgi:hypothetical protein
MAEAQRAIPDARHEPSDIGEGFIWGAVAVCLGTLIFCGALVFALYPKSLTEITLRMPLPKYPAPRLQASPPDDMRAFYAEEMRRLNASGWVDRAHGVAHIPIDEAMRKVAQEGIAGWPGGAPAAAHPTAPTPRKESP